MTSHPNRGSEESSLTPAPEQVKSARISAGLTQTAAAALVYSTCRAWQQWEAGDRRMHPAFWELFRLKSALIVGA